MKKLSSISSRFTAVIFAMASVGLGPAAGRILSAHGLAEYGSAEHGGRAEADISAEAVALFGPETFTRSSAGKDNFTRDFTAGNPSAPYTLNMTIGASDGSMRVRKGWLTLNGQLVLGPAVLNSQFSHLVVAIHLQQQNELVLKLKGGPPGSFVTLTIEPTLSTVLNDPGDPGFDSKEGGLGTPYGVAIDQAAHKAYVADRFKDSVFEFDILAASLGRSYVGVDGDLAPGNGGTTGICYIPTLREIVAINEGIQATTYGSIAVINPDTSSVRVILLISSGQPLHSLFVAVNPNNNVAAFGTLYDGGRNAYMVDLGTGAMVSRQQNLDITAPAVNPTTNEFVFAAKTDAAGPALLVYGATPPYQFLGKVDSSAPAGTGFEKLAIDRTTNVAVAVNQREGAVHVFDLAARVETARIPISVGAAPYSSADVAINPQTNMAVVTSTFIDRLTVINLTTGLVTAEIPLPAGSRPLGVDIDYQLNRAVVAENGLSSTMRNGSVFVVQLPSP